MSKPTSKYIKNTEVHKDDTRFRLSESIRRLPSYSHTTFFLQSSHRRITIFRDRKEYFPLIIFATLRSLFRVEHKNCYFEAISRSFTQRSTSEAHREGKEVSHRVENSKETPITRRSSRLAEKKNRTSHKDSILETTSPTRQIPRGRRTQRQSKLQTPREASESLFKLEELKKDTPNESKPTKATTTRSQTLTDSPPGIT